MRTLRFRLTLWNTAGVLAMVFVALAAIREGLRLTLSHMVDEFVGEELFAAGLDVRRPAAGRGQLYERLDRRAAGHPRRRLFVQVFDAGGGLLWSSIHDPDVPLPPVGGCPEETPVSVGEYRFVQGKADTPGGDRLTLRVGCSVQRSRAELARFTRMIVVVGGLLLLLAPLSGYWLAGWATRPLANIIATTARLHPAQLSERLPLRGTQDELDQLSLTINGLLDRIASYLAQVRDFTANAAHELRSPLTALHSSLEVALNADRSPEEYRELLSDLLEECSRLRTLVNQLLLLAEGDTGRLCAHREPVRLDEVVLRSLEMFQAVAESAGVELKAGPVEPVTVLGDGTSLWRVVNNLIDNALKYTPAGGSVTVSLRAEAGPGGCLLRVADTGAGIRAEDLPHVFERFYRGDKSRSREGGGRGTGTGLGLSICRSVVAAHGGSISLSSTPGSGTEVSVRLPPGHAAG